MQKMVFFIGLVSFSVQTIQSVVTREKDKSYIVSGLIRRSARLAAVKKLTLELLNLIGSAKIV